MQLRALVLVRQVFVLSIFLQLVLLQMMHAVRKIPPGDKVILYAALYCAFIGFLGTVFNFVLNQWIRGESISLRKALEVDRIDKRVVDWDDTPGGERAYEVAYEPGAARGLGSIARDDWEANHLLWERQMGLFDLSDQESSLLGFM